MNSDIAIHSNNGTVTPPPTPSPTCANTLQPVYHPSHPTFGGLRNVLSPGETVVMEMLSVGVGVTVGVGVGVGVV